MPYLRRLSDLTAADLPLAGGKGANLGEMTRAGLPVPPGFVLLTPAYRSFVAENRIQAEIQRLAGAARADDAKSLDRASAAIRALFDAGRIPDQVRAAAEQGYRDLGGGLVAVRSSATAEDLPGASFAGQQESYLNIDGPDEVLAAIRRCWSSLWTARAISYRARQGIPPQDVALAVVVQRLVAAEAAGVLFTANPINGRRDQMTIDGAWGLGESVVSGQVSPDQWVVDAATGAILRSDSQTKLQMTVRRPGGTAMEPVPAALRTRPVLTAEQVAAVVDLGRRTAAHFGGPQDLEWALAEGELFLLQSRPITSLFPIPAPRTPEPGLRIYASLNIIQGILEPITPAGISGFRCFAAGAARFMGARLAPGQDPPALAIAAGRMYMDVTNPMMNLRVRRVMLEALPRIDPQITASLRQVLEREAQHLPPLRHGFPLHPPIGEALRFFGNLICALAAPEQARRRLLGRAEENVRRLEVRETQVASARERLAFARETMGNVFFTALLPLLPVVIPGIGSRFFTEILLNRWLGDISGLGPVLRSFPHNPTTEMDLALWQISRRLKAKGAQPSAEHPAVVSFLQKYGHRAIREIDLGMPRWREDPAHVLSVLRGYLAHSEAQDPERQFREGARDAEQAARNLVAEVAQRRGRLRAWLLRGALRRIRVLGGLREYPKFYAIRTFAAARRALAGVGRDLTEQGRLDDPADVFFIDWRDLEQAVGSGQPPAAGTRGPGSVPGSVPDPAPAPESDLRALARANRDRYRAEMARRSIPRVITSLGETFYGSPVEADGALIGTPASAGVHEGRVRVILDPAGARLEPGEVLVAPGTDPAWTPLFLTAGALVMEVGGIMSHGSVVAREYGIPAVVGLIGATERLKTGQRVRVDGESGRVTPLE